MRQDADQFEGARRTINNEENLRSMIALGFPNRLYLHRETEHAEQDQRCTCLPHDVIEQERTKR
jgi:hypothetical protein